jgi:hypothetical protein
MLCCNIPELQNYTKLATRALINFKDVKSSPLLGSLQRSSSQYTAANSHKLDPGWGLVVSSILIILSPWKVSEHPAGYVLYYPELVWIS